MYVAIPELQDPPEDKKPILNSTAKGHKALQRCWVMLGKEEGKWAND